MCRRLLPLALAASLISACEEAERAPAPPPPSAAPPAADRTGEALDALWRESVQYRSAHQAMASNRGSLASDVARSARMLDTVEAFKRMPVVADPTLDAPEARKAVEAYAKKLGLRPELKLATPAPPSMPPAEITTDEGLQYTPEQTAGFHEVELTLGDGLESGPRFIGSLNALGRLFEPTAAHIGRDGEAVITGRVHYFRDLKPVKFVRRTPDFEARIGGLAPSPSETQKARIEEIRANLRTVEELKPDLEQAFAHQALLKISTARFRYYGALVERYNAASWAKILGAK